MPRPILALGVAACGAATTTRPASGGGDLSGSIRIDGSSTVRPLTEAVAEEFKAENSGVEVTVGTSGTGGGFEKFCAGETDISDASRAIEPEEVEACKKGGVGYEEVHVATDALTVSSTPRTRSPASPSTSWRRSGARTRRSPTGVTSPA